MSAMASKSGGPKVVAVVLNWNRLEDTLACLSSLACCRYQNLEVIVVDNGSRNSPAAAIAESFPEVEVVENPTNYGYAGGNNVGIRRALAAGADFVWVLNNDTEVAADALDPLVTAAAAHPRAGAVGGKVLRADRPEIVWVAWGRVTWLQSLVALEGEDAPDDGAYDGEHEVEWIPGCSTLLRSEALAEVGLFEDSYFAYHEDVEWAARAARQGWSCRYTGASRIYHHVHASSGGAAHYGGFRKYLSARNSVLYARSHGRPWQVALMAASIVVTLPFQLIRRAATGELSGVMAKIRGWRDGLLGRPVPLVELGLR